MSIQTFTTLYKWKIENFSQKISSLGENNSTSSDVFSLNEKCGAKFMVKLRNSGYIFLICTDFGRNQKMQLDVKHWRENSAGTVEATSAYSLEFDESDTELQCGSQGMPNMKKLAGSGALFICVEIQHKAPTKNKRKIGYEENEFTDRSKFGKTMLELHSEGYSDLTIQVEDKEFKASKLALMSCSDVFRRMLSFPNAIEAQSGIVKMENTKSAVIEAMLKWIYQVEIDNMDEVSVDLYRVADKYEIGPLKKYCANAMGESLSKENVPSRLILAYKFNEEHLKKSIVNFLDENSKHLKSLMKSDEWIQFVSNDSELAKKAVDDIFG